MSNSNCNEGSEHDFSTPLVNGGMSPVVEKCVSHIIEKEGFIYYNVNVKEISTNGGNYLATLQEVDIEGKSANGKKKVNLFLKNRLKVDDFHLFPLDEVYNREAFYYNDLSKIYNKLQDDANIPEEDRYRIAKSYDESNSDVTILDNLCKKGYVPWNRLDAISLEFAEMSIKQLAKFHSLSFAMKAINPKFFENNIKPMKPVFKIDSEFETFISNLFDTALMNLEGECKTKMENFLPKMIESYSKFVNISDNDSICLCHGDFRPNNTMLLKKNGKIQDLILVDFQLVYCGRPISDFVYFIFTGSDQAFRRAHLDNLKDLYYDTFEKFLKYFNIDAEDVYSKKRFEEEFFDLLNYGLTTNLMIIPFLFCDEDDIPELHNDMADIKIKWNEGAKKRWCEAVEDVILMAKM